MTHTIQPGGEMKLMVCTRDAVPESTFAILSDSPIASVKNRALSEMGQTANPVLKRFNSAPWVSPDIRMTH